MSQNKAVSLKLFFLTFFVFGLLTAGSAAIIYLKPELMKDWMGPAMLGAPPALGLIFFLIANALVKPTPVDTGQPPEDKTKSPDKNKPDLGSKPEKQPDKPPKVPPAPSPEQVSQPPDDMPDPETVVIQILGLFQKEGRLIDFLQEDLDKYDDAQIGASVREVHRGCRQVLDQILGLAPVLGAEEGADVEIDEVDPVRIKLVGNVKGKPPFKGVLMHCGWRCAKIHLPKWQSKDKVDVLAPAEVEIQ